MIAGHSKNFKKYKQEKKLPRNPQIKWSGRGGSIEVLKIGDKIQPRAKAAKGLMKRWHNPRFVTDVHTGNLPKTCMDQPVHL